jgi:hypothetical protein
MAQARGYRSKVAYGIETDFNTAPTSGATNLPIISISLSGKQPLAQSSVLRGSRSPSEPFMQNLDVSGDLVVPMDANVMGHMLRLMFGGSTYSGNVNTFKPGDTQPSATFEKYFSDLETSGVVNDYYRATGVKVDSMNFALNSSGEELVATFGLVGAGETAESASFDATPHAELPTARFTSYDAAITTASGASLGQVVSATVDVQMGLDRDGYVLDNTAGRSALPEGLIQCSGQLTVLFDDAAVNLVTDSIDGTKKSLKIALNNGTETLELLFPEIKLSRTSPAIEGPQGVRATLDWQSFYATSTEQSAIVAMLTSANSFA